jgi:ring-1,2-phenylacetyl-CoA epoxidase subunit PaaB
MSFQINKQFYGDYDAIKGGGGANENNDAKNNLKATPESSSTKTEWPLWEVFIRSKQGLDHKHVGSLHAADATMAIENARDVYTRRQEGVSIWVVESKFIHASNPDEADSFYEPANDKVYRHPTFYDLPDEIKHM